MLTSAAPNFTTQAAIIRALTSGMHTHTAPQFHTSATHITG